MVSLRSSAATPQGRSRSAGVGKLGVFIGVFLFPVLQTTQGLRGVTRERHEKKLVRGDAILQQESNRQVRQRPRLATARARFDQEGMRDGIKPLGRTQRTADNVKGLHRHLRAW